MEKVCQFTKSSYRKSCTDKLNEADNRIKEILANPAQYPIFESNDDNALLAFETNAPNQAPFYKATTLANRNDYAVSNVFVDFLQGKKAVFRFRTRV